MRSNYNSLMLAQHAFADTVSIDAWHDPFTEECTRADLRVDVTFRKDVPVGGEAESPVRFRLGLSRAEVAVIIPDDGTIGVDRDSVARDAPLIAGRRTDKREAIKKTSKSGQASLSLTTNPDASVKAAAVGEVTQTHSSETELIQNIQLMMVVHSAQRDGHSWEIRPRDGNALEGKPWQTAKEPRLKIIDKRSRKNRAPSRIIVEVRCRREDLLITGLELKEDDGKRRGSLFRKNTNANAAAAAEGYIRSCFEKAGLDIDVGAIDEKFIRLIISRTSATPNE